MLQLKEITKRYCTGGLVQMALNQVSLNFRENEFVSILGPSGSGKTTLLNIIGGLDHCDSGELIINGRATRMYKDRDWDSYRNHSIGFVFQSYNLIGHQSILANVELALAISGISRKERRRRAAEAIQKVGLGDQLHKKPNQLSGGQMQRVAIARALVNDPDILLADEPTGALDSETSVQVMELLKEVAKERLVIMVTHNPELAETYSTRIVKLRDGKVVDDTNPYETMAAGGPSTAEAGNADKPQKTSMSFTTALSLSFQNLKTKKGRTILTSFAGSIGIIGIALILALSTGVNSYMENIQKDTMSSYPITIDAMAMDYGAMMMSSFTIDQGSSHEKDKVYSSGADLEAANQVSGTVVENNLTAFRAYLEKEDCPLREHVGENGIFYSYNTPFTAYAYDPDHTLVNTDGSGLSASEGFQSVTVGQNVGDAEMEMEVVSGVATAESSSRFAELLPGAGELISPAIKNNYELVYGDWPRSYDEVLLVLNSNNEVPLQTLYALGMLPAKDYKDLMNDVRKQEHFTAETYDWSYEDFCAQTFYLVPECDFYQKGDDGMFSRIDANAPEAEELLSDAVELNITGIIRLAEGEDSLIAGNIGYTKALSDYLITYADDSEVVQEQRASTDKDIQSGMEIDEEIYDLLLTSLGYVDLDKPAYISIYTDSFEDKEAVTRCIEDYNNSAAEGDQIIYTDLVELLISSVTTIVDVISYVLIAFVAVSLIVSSLMIGIITYISVLERTKEIGILRAVGASKRNISQVFNAETVIIGLCAGVLGIVITVLFLVPVNAIIHFAAGTNTISASLPIVDAIILIALSVLLTFIGGLIPAKKAAKKDPVAALRSE